MRFGLSGWQSKGAWVSPQSIYQYKYLQGNVDVTLDLANLFGRSTTAARSILTCSRVWA